MECQYEGMAQHGVAVTPLCASCGGRVCHGPHLACFNMSTVSFISCTVDVWPQEYKRLWRKLGESAGVGDRGVFDTRGNHDNFDIVRWVGVGQGSIQCRIPNYVPPFAATGIPDHLSLNHRAY